MRSEAVRESPTPRASRRPNSLAVPLVQVAAALPFSNLDREGSFVFSTGVASCAAKTAIWCLYSVRYSLLARATAAKPNLEGAERCRDGYRLMVGLVTCGFLIMGGQCGNGTRAGATGTGVLEPVEGGGGGGILSTLGTAGGGKVSTLGTGTGVGRGRMVGRGECCGDR